MSFDFLQLYIHSREFILHDKFTDFDELILFVVIICEILVLKS